MKKIKVLVLVGLFFVCYQHVLFANQSDSGIFMSVSGRVVDIEKNVGIGDLNISIANITYRLSYDTKTDKNGYFIFKEVPDGHYTLYTETLYSYLYLKNLNHLIIDSESNEIGFDVVVGKNIINLNINLIHGASILGKVFGPDGKTPIQHARIEVDPYIEGKPPTVFTDLSGFYKYEGIKTNLKNNSLYSHSMSIGGNGYAVIDRDFNITKNGETITDFNIVLGIGIANLKGRIVYKNTGLPVIGKKITIVNSEETSAAFYGETITDDNGIYSILGFPEVGQAEIVVYLDESTISEFNIELKRGENNFNFEVEQNESQKKKI